ncbi:MAG: hypothetical protein UW68_C0008G0005 [Candidatus Collierbacteria bacterium GW2011_GWB1_44_6]|uniref:DNA polymerase III delta N-terminal domain-containing protein n=1 Tax=Candidatus Collierbacteria bacterium GW2011_GWB1_44_6 TaxID=1618384 RepID=A0A0G1JPK1_9BACT|nr:MAG: hypothetical protein UW68_C0008G0005 [Candidatus Collierbacteria bacterium GW2011_GWB1_44_6]
MITIVHGEDSLTSYKRLSQIIDDYKNRQIGFSVKDAGELDVTSLRQETGSIDLFGTKQLLVIKNLLGGVKSKQKDTMIELLKKNTDTEIILYEPKKLSDTALKPFLKSKIEAYNINPVIFKFLDIMRPGNTRVITLSWNKLLDLGHEPEYVFSMLARQIRLLIQAKSGASYLKLAPYPR